MNEAERLVIKQTDGKLWRMIREIIRLRRREQRLYELLIESEHWFDRRNPYGWRREKDTWTQQQIDNELNHITGRTD